MKKLLFTLGSAVALVVSPTLHAQELHSGIVHSQSSSEEFNLIKIHCDQLSNDFSFDRIQHEFEKYSKEIIVSYDVVEHKLFAKYGSYITPNFILGILHRVEVEAYYLQNGHPIYFQKTPEENYK